jgi:hypothetical protein
MRRIAKRAEIRIVRGFNPHAAAQPDKAVKFFHRADHIGQMLNDMNNPNLIKRPVGKRVRKAIQIADNIGSRSVIDIDPD